MADSPVERLIDQGLERYGKGDLDGALVAWESALALAPDDLRAAGYVEYVRGHYDLLKGQGGAETDSELAVPFGLADLHESDQYEIEISEEMQRARVEAFIDRVDDGWFLDEDAQLPTIARPLPLPARPDSIDAPLEMELEADEPEGDDRAPAIGPYTRIHTGDDDKTQDFQPARLQRLADFDGVHPFDDPAETNAPAPPSESSAAPASPGLVEAKPPDEVLPPEPATNEFDFGDGRDETAELGKQHLGFVKLPNDQDPAALQPGSGFAGPEMSTAEIRVRFKKDEDVSGERPSLEPAAAQIDPAADLDLPDPQSKSATLDLGPPGSIDLGLPTPPGAAAASPSDDDERTQERGRWARARSPRVSSREGSSIDHLDLDDGGSPSIAPPLIIDDPVMTEPAAFDPAHRNSPTREFPMTPTQSKTRDFPPLTKRPASPSSPPATKATLEFPPAPTTAKTIPRGARVAAPPAPSPDGAAPLEPAPPVPASRLLEELDAAAPAGESPDDRTRRRITGLLDRATASSKGGQHADAVAACDLALAEAPDSAVAQKLVHRSRDAIVSVYQGFLGNLDARPALAVPMHELPREQLDTRAAFLLSRVDGNLTLEEILDVSGMTRLETLRHLAKLVARGILSVR
ncbi:MAG TPA: hypothetical protein VL463_01810 [Kofleriaceae bacterium]|nr:hypothetical protein [Kofleriaceae bacterium]